MSDPPRRVAVVVLGMHRSGTSALTRLLGALGGRLAAELEAAGESGGKAGNWEAQAVSQFDERALAAAGSAWDDPLAIDRAWFASEAAAALADEGAALVAEQFADAPVAVVKDPRICRLVPLWQAILTRSGFEPRFALIGRHPLEVADSLAARNDFDRRRSLLLWLRHVLDAERETRGERRAFLSYPALLEDWRGVVTGLRAALELPLAEPAATAVEIDAFLSPALRHHRRSAAELGDDEPVERWAKRAQQALEAAAGGGAPAGELDAIRSALDTAEAPLRGTLLAERQRRIDAEERLERNREAREVLSERAERATSAAQEARKRAQDAARHERSTRRQLDALRSSRSWRLTAPLRRLGGGADGSAEPATTGASALGEPPAPFVIGVGRSGTTLLRLMLDAHPELAIPPETRFVPRLIRAAARPQASPAELVALLSQERNWADFGLSEDELLERLREAGGGDPGSAVRAFYKAYAARFGKRRWGDKTPPYGSRMPLIAEAVPEARFVHVVRDVRDVAASWRRFRAGRGDDPLTAAHWAHVWSQTIVETRIRAREVEHYVEVRYEDLVSAPERVLRQVCELIELPYDEAMLSYHLSAAERMAELAPGLPSAGDQPARSGEDRIAPHELTSEPPRADRAGVWREELTPAEVAEVEAVAGELLHELVDPS